MDYISNTIHCITYSKYYRIFCMIRIFTVKFHKNNISYHCICFDPFRNTTQIKKDMVPLKRVKAILFFYRSVFFTNA